MSWEPLVFDWIAASLVRPFLLVTAAALGLWLFRIEHPASRHAVWTAVLIGMLVLPIATLVLPTRSVPVDFPEWTTAPIPFRSAASYAGKPEVAFVPGNSPEERPVTSGAASSPNAAPETPPAASQPPLPAFAIGVQAPVQPASSDLIVWLYLSGVAAFASWRFIGWLLLRRILRRSRAIRGRVLVESDDVVVPASTGFLRPRVILPADWRSWSREVRRLALAHEMAHLRRRDLVTMSLARFVRTVFWFHPLAWWVTRRLAELAEMASDAVILERGQAPSAYAGVLVSFASRVERSGFRTAIPGLAMSRPSRLGRRIEAVFAASAGELRRLRHPALTLAGVGMPIVLLISTLGFSVGMPPAAAVVPARLPRLSLVAPEASSETPVIAVPFELAESPQEGLPNPVTGLFEQGECFRCHYTRPERGDDPPARLPLDTLDLGDVGGNAPVWEKVVNELRAGSMPPPGYARPGPDLFASAQAWLEEELDRAEMARVAAGRTVALSDLELAHRLARFLWYADPDAELRALAASGTLRNPEVLEAQVERMLSQRFTVLLDNFVPQLLRLWRLDSRLMDDAYSEDVEPLIEDARRETRMFVRSQIGEDRSILELLTADYTFVNERLARHYGIDGVTGQEFRRVTLEDERRRGLLGQASVLAAWSEPSRTSPTWRGIQLATQFLGIQVEDPPPNIIPIPEDLPGQRTSVRARLEAVTGRPGCEACHAVLDGLGFALQNFDETGAWQDLDGDVPADVRGMFPDGSPVEGPVDLRQGLLERREAFLHTFTAELLAYALSGPFADGGSTRGPRYYEMPSVRAIVREAEPSGFRWSAIINGIVRSTPFQTNRIDEAP